MSAQPETMPCRLCGHDVPAGRFCGRCGARLARERGSGPDWLRGNAYVAAPSENVLQPSLVSSVFPHLPRRSHGSFRVGLALVAAVLVAFCLLHWYVPMVAVATFAPLLLFVIYLTETGVSADLPWWVWGLTIVFAVAAGVGWALLTGEIVAESYSVGLGAETSIAAVVRDAVLIPFGGLLAMQLPTVLVRLSRPPIRESLYGFVIGVLAAMVFTVTVTMVRLIQEIDAGITISDQSVTDLLTEAGVRALTMPLTAASVSGLVGIGLWYTRRPGASRIRHLAAGALVLVVAAAAYANVGLVEVLDIASDVQFLVHVALALAAVVALRVGLQVAVLHEPQDRMHPGLPILCPGCGHVVPDMAFCPACGVAAHASSRASREARRQDRPQPGTELVQR
ncbi:zinc ribbon domain-containing protein [Mycobacterium sp. CVI_P3]|uniref:Zinc ribbon domain-containing protein n=1 Tax=Mycobacterium pinniadriaticum TaxID=2994102 RepID=A0ABT3SFK3_9MYCO|nr:zinc ribbon domain-containing protein [Mycobacterium pinniadriaticum]MCX2931494.1 zinc ribbon domain-containing protein [Mycobacterium pinniadriaticum]MCX2937918.1 zinc ribbon domain-containing protein [Mycobacterium pinniadriaticum]